MHPSAAIRVHAPIRYDAVIAKRTVAARDAHDPPPGTRPPDRRPARGTGL
jgi:hypothetical protein